MSSVHRQCRHVLTASCLRFACWLACNVHAWRGEGSRATLGRVAVRHGLLPGRCAQPMKSIAASYPPIDLTNSTAPGCPPCQHTVAAEKAQPLSAVLRHSTTTVAQARQPSWARSIARSSASRVATVRAPNAAAYYTPILGVSPALRAARLATARSFRRSAPSRGPRASVAGLVKKAAARGRSALDLVRIPPRGLWMARQLGQGVSRIRQMRRPAAPGEGIRPHWPRSACPNAFRSRRWPAEMTPRLAAP